MLNSDQTRILGEGVFCSLLAEPFFHSATDCLMRKEYLRALVGYLVGIVPAAIGLIVLNVIDVGPFRTTITQWIHPIIANPFCWLQLWFFLLLWLCGPRFLEKIRMAWHATAVKSQSDPLPKKEIPFDIKEALNATSSILLGRPVDSDVEPDVPQRKLEAFGGASSPMAPKSHFAAAVLPHEEIRFDYLPDSPTNHGWKQGYPSNAIPADAIWRAATDFPGGMAMALSDLGCAIDYTIGRSAALSKRIVCDFKFSNTAILFVRVKLATRDKLKTEQGFIKFVLGNGQPFFVSRYHEWELPIEPPSLGNGWHRLDIDLIEAVNRTWGQQGWLLSELVTIRLRGALSVSPIKLY